MSKIKVHIFLSDYGALQSADIVGLVSEKMVMVNYESY